MARRFGRNQKRKLRREAALCKIEAEAALARAMRYAQEADASRAEEWRIRQQLADVVSRLHNRAYTRCPKTGRWLEKEEKT